MINFVTENPRVLKRFLNKFKDLFSKRCFPNFCYYIGGLFLELKRTNIQTIVQKTPSASYQNVQYLISEAKWNSEKLNNRRVQILESNPATRSSTRGVVVIDDSSCKKWGLKTEGAKPQYSSTEDRVINCNVVVFSSYADSRKHWPIDHIPYKPAEEFRFGEEDVEFKSKLEIAKDLIGDLLRKRITFSDIVFDSWYFANHLIDFLQQKGKELTWITEAPGDRLISLCGKWVHADKLVKLIPWDKFKRRVTVPNSQRKNRTFRLYSFTTKLKGIPGKVLVVVAVGCWDNRDPKDTHIFVTNHRSLSPETVVKKYALRWTIEWIFRDMKENVAFDHYQVRYLKGISRHWHLSALAYTFLLWTQLNGSFAKTVPRKSKTMGEQLSIFRAINTQTCLQWMNKNPHALDAYSKDYAFLLRPFEGS